MNWINSLLARMGLTSTTMPTEIPNRLIVTELQPPYPQKDIPGVKRIVYLVRPTDPTRPLAKIAAEDGIPRLYDEYPHEYEKRPDLQLRVARMRVEALHNGTYYVVVDYAYIEPKPQSPATQPTGATTGAK